MECVKCNKLNTMTRVVNKEVFCKHCNSNLTKAAEMAKPKLFWKVYENKDMLKYFIDRLENIIEMYEMEEEESFKDCTYNDNIPLLEPVFLSENEFNDLPEFEGF